MLCKDAVPEAEAAMLRGTPNWLMLAIVASIGAIAGGATLVAVSTRPRRREVPGEIGAVVDGRPGWATLVLVLSVVVPLSVGLWFGLLCRLLR
jgi:hypothetical protein